MDRQIWKLKAEPGTMSVKSKVRSGNANANGTIYEAWLTHEGSDEPTGLKISGIPRVTLEKSD